MKRTSLKRRVIVKDIKRAEDWLTITEVAKLLGLSRRTIHDAILRGRLRVWRVGKFFVTTWEEVVAWRERIGKPLK